MEMFPLRDVWSSVEENSGEQCVTMKTLGIVMMLEWSVDN